MLQQEAMIKRVHQLCRLDERLVAAMMYGSFAQQEGDEFSDIEFILFFEDDLLDHVDQHEWVARIAPVELYFVNEFGNGTAIFENLVRGEFHFDRASDIRTIDESWRDTDWLPALDATLVLDRTGELTRRLKTVVGPPKERDTPEQVQSLCYRFINWFLFGLNLLSRGESARALDFLGTVQRQLLWMVRITEQATGHWPSPTKFLERDISEVAYARYAACTTGLDNEGLHRAYAAAWDWGREMMSSLTEDSGIFLPVTLLDRIGERLAEVNSSA